MDSVSVHILNLGSQEWITPTVLVLLLGVQQVVETLDWWDYCSVLSTAFRVLVGRR